MNEKCWEYIIKYICDPLPAPGMFWMPSNKIYIQCSVKKNKIYHEYLLDHEKKHYINYNSKRNFISKIRKDIKIDCDDFAKYLQNEELKQAKDSYYTIWNKNTPNKKQRYAKVYQEGVPNRTQRFHACIVPVCCIPKKLYLDVCTTIFRLKARTS